MKWLVALLLGSSAYAASKFDKSSLENARLPGGVVANKFIIEMAPPPNARRDVVSREAHESLYYNLRRRDVSFNVIQEFNDPDFFVGISVTLDDSSDSNKVASLTGVTAIRSVIEIPPPKLVEQRVVTRANDPNLPADTQSTHVLTGVDKLHALGITGEGIKVGIIDTGVDFNHPALGGGFGPGFKVIGGYDFVGDDFTGENTPVPDPIPLDTCNGHGTHVAGILGANPGNEFNISGVAFDAAIYSYRVFGCTGGVGDDIVVEALLRGVKDGLDILTMSLGEANGWTESTLSVVASRIAASGKIVTISAGNDGSVGPWFTSSPGNAINAISVASLDNTVIPLQNLTVTGIDHAPITYFDALPLPVNNTLPIFVTSTDTTVVDDACNPLPDSTPDLSPVVVVVRRGTCTFVQKLTNIAAKGGKVALIYDNGNGFAKIDVGNFTATIIQSQDGVDLVNAFASGAKVSVTFPKNGASTLFTDPNGGLISAFSSYGPSNDMFFKPAIAAPGGNILSTFPLNLGGFTVMSGTSMATPFMAGVSALLFSSKGNSARVGQTARTLFETTAQFVPSSKTDGDPLQTVAQQGAGLIDAFTALTTDVIVSPSELLLNDTAHFKGVQTFTVQNTGKTVKTFKLSHIPAGTMLSLQPGTSFPNNGPVPQTNAAASVSIFPNTVTVHPGQSQTVTVSIVPPRGVDPAVLPVYSGFIKLTNGKEQLHVTYLGLAAALRDAAILDTTDVFFGVRLPVIANSAGDFFTEDTNFTFVGGDFPGVLFRLNFGTPMLRVDLVDPAENITTTYNREGGILTSSHGVSGDTFAQVKTLGLLFEGEYLPRNSDVDDGTGFDFYQIEEPVFANGTTIPNGLYKVLLRVLKVTGDSTREEDFESWLSPIIGVQVPTK